jgi:hypothetical protein
MSNSASESSVPAAPQGQQAAKPRGLTSSDLNARVAEAIVGAAPRVLTSVVAVLVDKEINRRAEALLGGIELASQTKSALRKAQEPDVRPSMFTADGKPIGDVGYTKPRLAEIKKLNEKLAKVEKAIDAATRDENPEFNLLYNLKSDIEKAEKAAATESEAS